MQQDPDDQTSGHLPVSDESIRDDVLLELRSDPKMSSEADIAVAATNGVVALTGFVSSFWEKNAAEKAAKRVYAVKGLANDIEVKPFWQRADPQIARNVVRELENHVCIRADAIKVIVKEGWIILEGYVDAEYARSLAESVVKKVRGVIGVTNALEVRPKVTAQNLISLEHKRRLSQLNHRIPMNRGK